MTFDVFLCHNSKDKPAVRALGERLRDAGFRPWLDEWELEAGGFWSAGTAWAPAYWQRSPQLKVGSRRNDER